MSISTLLLRLFLEKKLKASSLQICELISLCTTSQVNSVSELQQDMSCSVCEAILTIISSSNASINMSSSICVQAPVVIQEPCSMFLGNYSHLITDGLNQKLTPRQICNNIKICSKENTKTNGLQALAMFSQALSTPNMNDGLNAQCQACQWVISAIEAYLAQDTTEVELSRVFATLCTVFPGQYSNICQNFVLVYMSEAVGYIIDNLTPPFVCESLKLCGVTKRN